MQATPQIQLEDFLHDISGPNPVGTFLRYASEYDNIREALREEDDLPQGVWVRDIKVGNWQEASTLCQDVLIYKSKDLQVAAWLMESWMFLNGMPGFIKGLALMQNLSQKYWDIIYPTTRENDLEYRLAPFYWVNEKLSERMNRILITNPINQDLRSYPFSSWIEVSRLSGLYPDRSSEGKPVEQAGTSRNPTLADFNLSLDKTSLSFYKTLQEQIQTGLEIIQSLSLFLDQKMGKEAPTLYRLRNKLIDFSKFTTQTLVKKESQFIAGSSPFKDQNSSEESEQNLSDQDSLEETLSHEEGQRFTSTPIADAANKDSNTSDVQVVVQNREQAYALIASAIHYLKRNEPQSPLPYLMEKISSWNSMSFLDLVNHLKKEEKKNILGILKEAYDQEQ